MVVLPERLETVSWAHVRVEDGLVAAKAALGGDYGERFEFPSVELINLMSDQAMFTFDDRPTVGEP